MGTLATRTELGATSEGGLGNDNEKAPEGVEVHIEHSTTGDNLFYADDDVEPELHARTYIAIVAMFLQIFVFIVALQGPPVVLSMMGTELNNPQAQTWIVNSYSLVQAVLAPILSSASDAFQARKSILIVTNLISLVGAAIAPGSKDIYRLIASQCLMGVSFAASPIVYCIPSEIVPHKWRPLAQAFLNTGAGLGSCIGPLMMGALANNSQENGWRTFFWIQTGLYGLVVVGILIGYRPPKRHHRLEHASFWRKIAHLDLPGGFLLAAGLTLLLTGLGLGGTLYKWTNDKTLATIVVGILTLIIFGVYEWRIKTGILHRDLFAGGKEAGRTFAFCVFLIMMEGVVLFAYTIFYPVLATAVFGANPLLLAAREMSYYGGTILFTGLWGYLSSRFRTIREPLFAGFVIYTVGMIGLATTQQHHGDRNSIIFAGVSGIGFASLLVLIIAGVQLSTPHHLIATACAVITSARSVAGTTFTAIYSATLSNGLSSKIPDYISAAALKAGLPGSSIPAFIGALASHDEADLAHIPGVTPEIIAAGVHALKEAYIDSLRNIFIIAVPFGVLGCIACLFIGTLRKAMTYRVDAPVEKLHAKHH